MTEKRILQHEVEMLYQESQKGAVEVSAKRHDEMYDDADRLQEGLVKFRRDFHQEMLDWKSLREDRLNRRSNGKRPVTYQ